MTNLAKANNPKMSRVFKNYLQICRHSTSSPVPLSRWRHTLLGSAGLDLSHDVGYAPLHGLMAHMTITLLLLSTGSLFAVRIRPATYPRPLCASGHFPAPSGSPER